MGPSHDSSSRGHLARGVDRTVASVPLSSPTLEALSFAEMDGDVVRSDGLVIDHEIQADDVCLAFADALKNKGLMLELKMPNTRSGASRTREAVNEQSDRRNGKRSMRGGNGTRGQSKMEEIEMEGNKDGGNEIEEMKMAENGNRGN
ncbi:hypothetical protein Tco_1005378 [Tanacetum coccineum]|uniref:Uncharacterized protein n=1 Tax=Tanacetum coccineum TaxID=301880 RepID=A0ABQ5FFV7_9ASTR